MLSDVWTWNIPVAMGQDSCILAPVPVTLTAGCGGNTTVPLT